MHAVDVITIMAGAVLALGLTIGITASVKQPRRPRPTMDHTDISTYCQHSHHGDCRLTCKICEAPCGCYCHTTQQVRQPNEAE